jgi:hypothetical protein
VFTMWRPTANLTTVLHQISKAQFEYHKQLNADIQQCLKNMVAQQSLVYKPCHLTDTLE